MAKTCLNCSETSGTTYSRCPEVVSTNCTFYQGVQLTCESDPTFSVCKGDNLSIVQEKIFNKICELSGLVDVTTIKFPCTLQEAWEEQDATILNLLSYFADIACSQQASIVSLGDDIKNLNPEVDICLQCCGDDCGSTKLLLSDALNKIVACLCDAKAQITALQTQVDIVQAAYNGIQSQIDLLKTFQTQQLTLNVDLQQRLIIVEGKTYCLPECP